MASETEFATGGVRHFKVWTISKGVFKGKNGAFGTGGSRYTDTIISLSAINGKYVSGTPTGDLIVWNGPSISKGESKQGFFKTHLDAIHCSDSLVFCGDRVGNVKILTSNFQAVHSFALNDFK